MAFPSTAVLDNFNRANAASLGANWTASPWNYSWTRQAEIDSNAARDAVGLASDGNSYWNVATYGPDAEVYVDISASTSTDYFEVGLRILTPATATARGYYLELTRPNTLKVWRVDNGAATQLGATITQAVAVGDSIGLSAVGSTLTVYHKPSAGAWTSLTTRTDATYSSAGYLEIYVSGAGTPHLDNFGGGTVVAAGGAPAQLPMRTLTGAGI